MRQADIKSAQISITLLLLLPIVALPFKKTGLNQYNAVKSAYSIKQAATGSLLGL